MQRANFMMLVKERDEKLRVEQQLVEARAELESLRVRNGSYRDELRGCQRQLAQYQYKLKRQASEKDDVIRKVALMQEQHASRCARLSKVSGAVAAASSSRARHKTPQDATSAESKLRDLTSAFRGFLHQYSAIVQQLSPLLAASSSARATLLLVRQLQSAGDDATHAVQSVLCESGSKDLQPHEGPRAALDPAALWGRLERSMQNPQAARSARPAAPRPPRPATTDSSVAKARRQRPPSAAGSVASSRSKPTSNSQPKTHTRTRAQRRSSPKQTVMDTKHRPGTSSELGRPPAAAERLLHMMALTAQRAQEDAATAQAELQGTRRELEFARAAAAAAPSNSALLAAAQAADRLAVWQGGTPTVAGATASTAQTTPQYNDSWASSTEATSVASLPSWTGSSSPSIHARQGSNGTAGSAPAGQAASVSSSIDGDTPEQHTERDLQLQSLAAVAHPVAMLTGVVPAQPPAPMPVAHAKPARKHGHRPPLNPGSMFVPDLRADDDDALPLPGRPQRSASGLIAHALAEAKGADSYVSSAQGSPASQQPGATLDDEISALEQSLAALGMSGSSGSGNSSRSTAPKT